jgi:hypothetical protein
MLVMAEGRNWATARPASPKAHRFERIRDMSFEHWWTRASQAGRIVMLVAAISAMALGGAADHFWG